MEGEKRVCFGGETLDGDDERTENERSPSPSRKRTARAGTGSSGAEEQQHFPEPRGQVSDQPRRGPRTRSRPNHRRSSSNSGSESGQPWQQQHHHHHHHQQQQQMALSAVSSSNRMNRAREGSPRQAEENGKQEGEEEASSRGGGGHHHNNKVDENLRRKRRNNRKRNHRKWKPYARLTWEEKKELDELESKRATKKRANRPTPYNTTQFLMEDHKVDTPDLSAGTNRIPGDSSDADELFDETSDLRDGDFLEREFSAMYDEVQSERLHSMSKEQLVSEVLTLSKRVTELEETQPVSEKGASSDDPDINGHSNAAKEDLVIRARLESLDDLQHEVQRLREENSVLKRANHSLEL